MELSIDIRSLNRQLSQLITKPTVGSKRRPGAAVSILKQLRQYPMTLELLLKSKVGHTVNHIRSLKWSEEVSEWAEKVINEWKHLLPKVNTNDKKRSLRQKSSFKRKKRAVNTLLIDDEIEDKENEIPSQPEVKNDIKVVPNKSNDERKGRVIENKTNVLPKESNEGYVRQRPRYLRPLKPLKSILKTTKLSLIRASDPRTKKFKKLPPIGQMPEYSAERLRERRAANEDSVLSQPSTSKSFPRESPIENGIGGHQLYENIVRKRKLERTYRLDSPTKRTLSFRSVGVDRLMGPLEDKPKVENWPVPHSIPILTPADRLRIIQSRSVETPNPEGETSNPKIVTFDDEPDLGVWRTRSSKSLTKIIPRKEHKPKWMSK